MWRWQRLVTAQQDRTSCIILTKRQCPHAGSGTRRSLTRARPSRAMSTSIACHRWPATGSARLVASGQGPGRSRRRRRLLKHQPRLAGLGVDFDCLPADAGGADLIAGSDLEAFDLTAFQHSEVDGPGFLVGGVDAEAVTRVPPIATSVGTPCRMLICSGASAAGPEPMPAQPGSTCWPSSPSLSHAGSTTAASRRAAPV